MANTKHKRRIKIIKPRLQLKLVSIFVGLAALSALLQSLMIARRLTELSSEIPSGGQYIVDALPSVLGEILMVTFGLLLPLTFAVGVLVTFRIAGPVYRFEQYLGQVERGEVIGPCKIREGDELQDLCDAINRATVPLRQGPTRDHDSEEHDDTPSEYRAAG